MKNADLPAMPIDNDLLSNFTHLCDTESTGLTKREIFAMHAMQGMLSNSPLFYPSAAVRAADALLGELEK